MPRIPSFHYLLVFLLPFLLAVLSAPIPHYNLSKRETTGEKLVFSHFMIGIVSNRNNASDYDADMQRAKSYGIDAFALNIGTDDYTDKQLGYAYESAANNDMKVFLSFDFNWWDPSDASGVGSKIAQFGSKPAQLTINGKVFVSSFSGDGLDITTVRSTAGLDLFVAPNFHPGEGDFSNLDGALNWMGWPSDGNNKAPQGGVDITVTDGDETYLTTVADKSLIAPASPWFSTHFGGEVTYSKNWVFPGDLLWYQRWNDILTSAPEYVEIVTWNDYGESHYVAPLSSPHTDDGGSKWVNDMPHNGWLEMAKPFISAYKAGSTSVSDYIKDDQLIYWYRPTPRDIDCDSTDTTMGPASNTSGNYFNGRPNGWETLADEVFVVSLLTANGTVTVNSGGTEYSYDAPAGASAFSVPMGLGAQAFALTRGGNAVVNDTSLKEIVSECIYGIYNFNAYVGTVPAGDPDSLQADGLAALTTGLAVACEATPSLPATAPATVAVTATGTPTPAPTASV
ncbi:probable alpha-1,3-glucanase/mutanase [Armillaria ostoyae]|uniref:Probable alpha-1,3-glucanase/mutanase n=1 Tax=Armillaria ostoyae TaxID=47428 RepID=A0A284QN38_ARMOS|nr:probable alpha-1,3-glucanase/mutanase [Armillaria ostoyae]